MQQKELKERLVKQVADLQYKLEYNLSLGKQKGILGVVNVWVVSALGGQADPLPASDEQIIQKADSKIGEIIAAHQSFYNVIKKDPIKCSDLLSSAQALKTKLEAWKVFILKVDDDILKTPKLVEDIEDVVEKATEIAESVSKLRLENLKLASEKRENKGKEGADDAPIKPLIGNPTLHGRSESVVTLTRAEVDAELVARGRDPEQFKQEKNDACCVVM